MHLDGQQFAVRSKRRSILRKIVSVLCCLVVFCTTYALILPAITMENQAFCGKEEHLHTEECFVLTPGQKLICEIQPQETHVHNETCFAPAEPVLHTHTDACYAPGELLCQETAEDHLHEAACYEVTVVCGMEEGAEEPAEPVLLCTEPVIPAHEHDETCYEETEPQLLPICSIEDPEHVHEEACYPTDCGLEGHSHSLACFSDPEADVEDAAVWEAALAHVSLNGDPATDLAAIAKSQLGYAESTLNYEVGEDNSIHGYTRYGAWYGRPYGSWNTMFVSFCLHYAGVEGMSHHHSAQALLSELTDAGQYYTAQETQAQTGSLIFLNNGRIGIVVSVQDASEQTQTSIRVIEGDHAGSVAYTYYAPDDSAIMGYGLLPGQEPIVPEIAPEMKEEENEAPAVEYFCGRDDHEHDESCLVKYTEVVITSSSELVTVTYFAVRVDAPEAEPAISTFRFSGTPRLLAEDEPEDDPEVPTGPTELRGYVLENGGEIALELLTEANNRPPMDETGNFVIEPNTQYQLTLGFSINGHGMESGSYVYQFPKFFAYANQHGYLYDSADKNALLGEWTLDENGLMSFEFYKESNNYQSVSLTTTIQTFVKESVEQQFSFDGKVYVVIIPDDELETEMTLTKFATMDNEPGKIKWTVVMKPGSHDTVAGMVVHDTLGTDQHYFSQSDKDAGITVGYNNAGTWHQIVVQPTWTEDNGYTFTFPENITCGSCNNHTFTYIPGAKYYLTYTTTSKIGSTDAEGYYQHENTVEINDLSASASISQQIGTPAAKVEKTGWLDPVTQEFQWQIRANIPAYTGGRSMYWQWADIAQIINLDGWSTVDKNLPRLAAEDLTVTISANGRTLNVPYVSQVTRNDFYCYDFRPVSDYSDMSFFYIAAPCNCTAETCANWSVNAEGAGWCNSLYWSQSDQAVTFCTCWTETTDALVTIDMAYEGTDLIEKYGTQDLTFVNGVRLQGFYYENGQQKSNAPLDAQATIPIPHMIEKTLLNYAELGNGYVARYRITVNDSKLDLSTISDPGVSIVDEMSEYLFYVPGTMVIRQIDKNNQERTLQYGTDYTMTSRQETKEGEMKNILTVNLLHPDACQYVLEYDAKVLAGTVTNPSYENAATVYLAGKSYSSNTDKTFIKEYYYSAASYNVTLQKQCASSGQPLAGAKFGLFGQNGEKLTEAVTNDEGLLVITTDLENNIVYKLHEPYYLQELQAPTGYILEDTKYWFYICGKTDGTCTECANVPAHPGMVKAPADIITATNTMGGPVLPNTGGHGTTLYTMGGMLLTLAAAALLYTRKRSRKENP